jgi:hypothetical protein
MAKTDRTDKESPASPVLAIGHTLYAKDLFFERDTRSKLGQSKHLPHVLNRDLAPCA